MAKGKGSRDKEREQRLAEALRANLKRRKEQARAVEETVRRDGKPSD